MNLILYFVIFRLQLSTMIPQPRWGRFCWL